MVAQQSPQNKNLQKCFAFLNVCYPKTHLIRLSTILIVPYHKNGYYKIKNQETLRDYFCLKMISKLAPQQIFPKNIKILEAWKPTEEMKFRLELIFSFT